MKIIDYITNEILTINDYMDAIREAKSRVKYYKSENIEYKIKGDTITIRRK